MLFCCHLLTIFKFNFQKNLSGTQVERQTVWDQIKTDNMLVLIWAQTVCKGYQQTTKVLAAMKELMHMGSCP